jgi:hypothetical protein
MKHNEYNLQVAVCEYINLRYKNTLFYSDTIAAIKLTAIQGMRNKKVQKDGFKLPDIIILQPKHGYGAMMIELKLASPYYAGQFKKLKKNPHIEAQSDYLERLIDLEYYACFAWTLDMAISIIDNYMAKHFIDYNPHTPEFYNFFYR